MFGLGWMELTLLLVVLMLIFGAGRIAQVGKGLGEAIHEFKKGSAGK